LRVHVLRLETEAAGGGGLPADLDEALGAGRYGNRSGPAEARRLARLFFQASVKLGALAGQSGQVRRRPQLAEQPGRVPRGTTGQLAPFEQADATPTASRQVKRHTTADDPAADDDNLRPGACDHPDS